ncbi:MAG: hypothetical protein IGS03_08475 [Candidatus Sericytochromatia bacterium]|nr:hypothetical protein [Candidatus Sericytochromatia bacterium]
MSPAEISEAGADYPEAAAVSFEPARLNAVLQTQGALLLRGLFPQDLIVRLHQAVADTYAKTEQQLVAGTLPPDFYQSLYRYGHVRRSQIAGYDALEAELMGQPLLRRLLQARYGSEVMLLSQNTLPRRQDPAQPERAIALHQDQEFAGPLRSGLNLWIPLTPAGGEAPGLEIWLGHPQVPLLALDMPDALRAQVLANFAPCQRWRPVLQPGDALLLSFFTLHQTWVTPEMQQLRLSHEMRLASAQDTALSLSPLSRWFLD